MNVLKIWYAQNFPSAHIDRKGSLGCHNRQGMEATESVRVFVTDYGVGQGTVGKYGSPSSSGVAHIIGVTPVGDGTLKTVHVAVTDFYPKFHVPVPNDANPTAFMTRLKMLCTDVIGAKLVQGVNTMGFTNMEKMPFVEVTVMSIKAMTFSKRNIKDTGVQVGSKAHHVPVYTTDLPVLQLESVTKLCAVASWIRVTVPAGTIPTKASAAPSDVPTSADEFHAARRAHDAKVEAVQAATDAGFIARTDINLKVRSSAVSAVPAEEQQPFPETMRYAAWDIETYKNRHEGQVISIGMQVWTVGGKLVSRSVFYHGPEFEFSEHVQQLRDERDAATGVKLQFIHCTSETDMINKTYMSMHAQGAMFTVGYNSHGYDLPFVMTRCDKAPISKIVTNEKHQLREDKDGVYGASMLRNPTVGLPDFDVMKQIRDTHKLRSYKLNSVAQHFFGGHKDDGVNYEFIKTAWHTKDPEMLAEVAVYCDQDVTLTAELCNKLQCGTYTMYTAQATHMPTSLMVVRTITNLVLSCFLWHLHQYGYVLNSEEPDYSDPRPQAEGKYKGAKVLNPSIGLHRSAAIFDFNSLYPNIIKENNLCFSTKIIDPKYENLPGVTYHECDGRKFAHNPNHGPPPLCIMVRSLLERRAQIKKIMKTHPKGSFLYSLYDTQQLAVKLLTNAIYGWTGLATGRLPCLDLAVYVTQKGQQHIDTACCVAYEEFSRHPFSSLEECMARTLDYMGDSTSMDTDVIRVLYGDTDSIMFSLSKSITDQHLPTAEQFPRRESWSDEEYEERRLVYAYITCAEIVGKKASEKVGINMELEKIMLRYLLRMKKNYAGLSYTSAFDMPTLLMKGLVAVRRDHPKFICEGSEEVLEMLCRSANFDKVREIIARVAENIEGQVYELEDFALSKEIKQLNYKTQQPHDMVRKRLAEIEEDSAPKVGDRVSFVVCHIKGKHKVSDCAYSVEEIAASRRTETPLEIDRLYYLDSWRTTIEGLLGGVMPPEFFEEAIGASIKRVKAQFIQKARRQGARLISEAFKPVSASESTAQAAAAARNVEPSPKRQLCAEDIFNGPKKPKAPTPITSFFKRLDSIVEPAAKRVQASEPDGEDIADDELEAFMDDYDMQPC